MVFENVFVIVVGIPAVIAVIFPKLILNKLKFDSEPEKNEAVPKLRGMGIVWILMCMNILWSS